MNGTEIKNTHQYIGACALLLNSQNQVLLGKRKNNYKAGYYGLPGGHIELNEPIAKAIKREIAEETGMQLNNLDYVGVVRENQDEHDFIHFVYVAHNVIHIPVLMEPEKCEGWKWFAINEIYEKILPGHLAAIQIYQQQKTMSDLTNLKL